MSLSDLVHAAVIPGFRKAAVRDTESSPFVRALFGGSTLPIGIMDTRRRIGTSEQMYMAVSMVYSCVSVIAQTVAQCRLRVLDAATEQEIDIDPRVAGVQLPSDLVIFRRPNRWQTYYEFWEATFGFLELRGECPWLLLRDKRGQVVQILPVRPDRVDIVPSATDYIDHYILVVGTERVVIAPEDMIFWRYWNPQDDWRGLSPISAAALDVELDLCAVEGNRQMFANGVRPSGVMTTDMPIQNQEMLDRVADRFNEKYAGYQKIGKVIFLSGGFKWQAINLSAKDMETIEQRKFSEHKVRQIYRVPPLYTMDLTDASVLANADVQERLLWEANILPKLRRIEERLNEFILPLITQRSVVVRFDYSRVDALRKNTAILSQIYQVAMKLGAVTPNEVRVDVLGKPRIDKPEMDTHYIDPALMPLAIDDQEAGIPAARVASDIMMKAKALADSSKKVNDVADEIAALRKWQREEAWRQKARNSQQRFNRLAEERIRRFAGRLGKLFAEQRDEVLANLRVQKMYKAIDPAAVQFDFDKWVKRFEEEGRPEIAVALRVAGEQLLAEVGAEGSFEVYNERVLAFIGARVARYANLVNETTKQRVDEIVRQGIIEGLDIESIGKRIEQFFDSPGRAQMIARTEVVSGMNFGRIEGMRQGGYEYHRWMTQRDSEVRPDHALADGQVVKVGDEFTQLGDGYGGDRTYPSDFNERCYTIPVSPNEIE